MSAGTGITHSEMNSHDNAVHLLQIWIQPNVQNAEPTYQQIQLNPKHHPNQWHLIAGDSSAPMLIRQNAEVKTAMLEQDQHVQITAQKKVNYVHIISGEVQIADHAVKAGDALVFDESATVRALQDSQIIWFDLP